MNYVGVKFEGRGKTYFYKTKLNLIYHAEYKIKNECGYNYDNTTVMVVDTDVRDMKGISLHEIVEAKCIDAPKIQSLIQIKNIYENRDKGTTVIIWEDDIKTILKCDREDIWDREKVIALAYMKRIFNNRGCFNNVIKKWCKILCEREEKEFNKCM